MKIMTKTQTTGAINLMLLTILCLVSLGIFLTSRQAHAVQGDPDLTYRRGTYTDSADMTCAPPAYNYVTLIGYECQPGSSNYCCSYKKSLIMCSTGAVNGTLYELMNSYNNSHCVNNKYLSWTAPGEAD